MTSTREQPAFDDAALHQLRFQKRRPRWNGTATRLMARVEGWDASFFAVAESKNGVDGFRSGIIPFACPTSKTGKRNLYDMRLVVTKTGWINGVFLCRAA